MFSRRLLTSYINSNFLMEVKVAGVLSLKGLTVMRLRLRINSSLEDDKEHIQQWKALAPAVAGCDQASTYSEILCRE